MKIYSFKIKIIAATLITMEIFVLMVLGYFVYIKYKGRVLGVSVSRINKNNIVLRPDDHLKHFYEWDAHQTIVYDRSWLPYVVTTKTNNDGLISLVDYEITKPPSVFRIIALGDSFTEGPFVDPDLTYPKQLGIALNAQPPCASINTYEVLNFGVGGYDIEYAAARFLSRGVKYQPDMIIWFLKNDDFIERAEVNFRREAQYVDYIQNALGGDISKFEPYKKWITELNYDENLASIIHRIVVKEDIEQSSHKYYLSEQDASIRDVASWSDIPVLIATFSDTQPIFLSRMKSWADLYANVHVFADITPLKPGEETFEPHNGHPNAAGYTAISQKIYQNIQQIASCQRVEQ